MKKIMFLIVITFSFFIGVNTCSANDINSIEMYVYIDGTGTATIKEVWDVDGTDGTEWYKVLKNLGNSEVRNFKVSMDGKELTYKNWNVNESLQAKKGYYGINKINNGVELCFGKYDYNKHTFTLTYDLSNIVFNTDDYQALYFTFIDKLSNVDFKSFKLELSTYYKIENDIKFWAYGYDGKVQLKDGKIIMTSSDNMTDYYGVLLVRFPKGKYLNTTSYSQFTTFEDVFNAAEEGSYRDNEEINSWLLLGIFGTYLAAIGGTIYAVAKSIDTYGFMNNKKLKYKEVPYFRDIPCNDDIYYAHALLQANYHKGYGNLLGAILLKWIKIGKLTILKQDKDKIDLELHDEVLLENELENELYELIKIASKDNILSDKELEKWARKNHKKYLKVINKLDEFKLDKLKEDGSITKSPNKKICKKKWVMNDILYEDSKQLLGLKRFLEDFSKIDDKKSIEVYIWESYLIYATLFDIADEVAKELKNIYPNIMEETNLNGVDLNTCMYLSNISSRSVTTARSMSSSGGSGSSSFGGGGGSFGGGGGGSR